MDVPAIIAVLVCIFHVQINAGFKIAGVLYWFWYLIDIGACNDFFRKARGSTRVKEYHAASCEYFAKEKIYFKECAPFDYWL